MKRLILTALTAAAVAAPLAVATSANAQYNRHNNYNYGYDRYDRGDRDRDHDRDRDRHHDRDRGRYDRDRDHDRRGRWDDQRYNGYYYGNRWYYGAPPQAYYYNYDYRPGYQPWRRGQYLPPAYRGRVIYDYRRYGLRNPPRGYHWVQSNNDYLLAAIATGLILEVIAHR